MRRHVEAFERRARRAFPEQDKVMMGHVHSPKLERGYINCGDWLVHCSAIVEHFDGTLELVYG
jgi:UDP-2,3-diacylglucosamine pyrophosphatase LpxH